MKTRQTIVGAFVLGGGILILVVAILFGNLNLFRSKTKAVVVFQEAIHGLNLGAAVTFRGVRIGTVKGIHVIYDSQKRVAFIPVEIEVDPSLIAFTDKEFSVVRTPSLSLLVKNGLQAELNLQSFVTGQADITLSFSDNPHPVPHHEGIVNNLIEIPARSSPLQLVKQTLDKLPIQKISDDTLDILKMMRNLIEKLDRDLDPTLQSLKSFSDISQESVQVLRKDTSTTLSKVNQMMDNSNRQIVTNGQEMTATLKQMQTTLSYLNALLSPNSKTRMDIEYTIRDLSAAAASMRGVAADIEQNPQLLLKGRRQ